LLDVLKWTQAIEGESLMPIYEYRCNNCQRKVSVFLRTFSASPKCPSCGSEDLARLISAFAMIKGSPTDIYDDILSDKGLMDGLMRNDPRALAAWNKKMSRGTEMGGEMAPEYEEMLERMEHGEMPQMPMGGMPEEDIEGL
jgi:putative FmdB family regulatory protein